MGDVYGGGWSNGELPFGGLVQHLRDRRASRHAETQRQNEEYTSRIHQASLAQQNWLERAAFAHQSTADLAQRLGPKSRIASAGYNADGSVAVTWHQPAPAKPRQPKPPAASPAAAPPAKPSSPASPAKPATPTTPVFSHP